MVFEISSKAGNVGRILEPHDIGDFARNVTCPSLSTISTGWKSIEFIGDGKSYMAV
jgi:hypothetical protein